MNGCVYKCGRHGSSIATPSNCASSVLCLAGQGLVASWAMWSLGALVRLMYGGGRLVSFAVLPWGWDCGCQQTGWPLYVCSAGRGHWVLYLSVLLGASCLVGATVSQYY